MEKIESNTENLSYLTEATEEIWQFLTIRFTILKKAVESGRENLLKNLSKGKKGIKLSNRQQMIFQLLKNEQKLLELLAHCANDHLTQCQQGKKDDLTKVTSKDDNDISDVE